MRQTSLCERAESPASGSDNEFLKCYAEYTITMSIAEKHWFPQAVVARGTFVCGEGPSTLPVYDTGRKSYQLNVITSTQDSLPEVSSSDLRIFEVIPRALIEVFRFRESFYEEEINRVRSHSHLCGAPCNCPWLGVDWTPALSSRNATDGGPRREMNFNLSNFELQVSIP